MKEKIDPKLLSEELSRRIRGFYPYFLIFYVLSLLVSLFSQLWKTFFYWPAMHFSFILLSILLLLTFKINFGALKKLNLSKFFKIFWQFVYNRISSCFIVVKNKFYLLPYKKRVEILVESSIALLILLFSLISGVGIFKFLFLVYALASILIPMKNRLSASLAMVGLVLCPILILFKKNGLSEQVGIYVYYFLLLAVIGEIIGLQQKREVNG